MWVDLNKEFKGQTPVDFVVDELLVLENDMEDPETLLLMLDVLLQCGADPNHRTENRKSSIDIPEKDPPLYEVVKALQSEYTSSSSNDTLRIERFENVATIAPNSC